MELYVNATKVETDKRELTYHEIVELAGLPRRDDYTMVMDYQSYSITSTGKKRKQSFGGSVTVEDTILLHEDGKYIFDVVLTNNA